MINIGKAYLRLEGMPFAISADSGSPERMTAI